MADYVYGVHDFEAENPDEISFAAGDRIEVIERDDEFGDGWWTGRNGKGEEGLFPKSYTDPVRPSAASQNSLDHPTSFGARSTETDPTESGLGDQSGHDIQQAIQTLTSGSNLGTATGARSTSADTAETLGRASPQKLGREPQGSSSNDDDMISEDRVSREGAFKEMTPNNESARKALQERAARNGFLEPTYESGTRPASAKSKDSYGFDDESASEASHHPAGNADALVMPPPKTGLGVPRSGASDYRFDTESDEEGQRRGIADAVPSRIYATKANNALDSSSKTPSTSTTIVEGGKPSEGLASAGGLGRSNTLASELRNRTASSPKTSHVSDQRANALDRFEARQRLGSPTTEQVAIPAKGLGSPVTSSNGFFKEPAPLSALGRTAGGGLGGSATPSDTVNVQSWTPREVHAWLLSRGFDAQTANVFLDQEISGDVLLEVDTNMLKEIGISAFGKRFQIMTAVKNLKGSSNQSPGGHSLIGESPRTPGTAISGNDRYSSSTDLPEALLSGYSSNQRSFSDSSGYRSFEPSKKSQLTSDSESFLANRSVSGPAGSTKGQPSDYFPTTTYGDDLNDPDTTTRSTATLVGPQVLSQAAHYHGNEQTRDTPEDRAAANRERYLEHLSQASATGISNTGLAGSRAQQRNSDDPTHNRNKSGDSKGSRGSGGRASMFIGLRPNSTSQQVRSSGQSGDFQDAALPSPQLDAGTAPLESGGNGVEPSASRSSMGNRILAFGRAPKKAPSRTRKEMIGSPLERPGSLKSESTVTGGVRKTSFDADTLEPSILSTIIARDQVIMQQGWIRKKAEGFNVGWKVRYAILTGNSLFILKNPDASKLKERIELVGYKVSQDDSIKYGFKLTHESSKKTHQLATDELQERKDWMKATMRCLIRRDWTQPVISSSNVPTISLEQAQAQYPPPRPPSPGKKSAARTSINRNSQGRASTTQKGNSSNRVSRNPRSDSPGSQDNDGFVSADEDLVAAARYSMGEQPRRQFSGSDKSGDSDYISQRLQGTDFMVSGMGPLSIDTTTSSEWVQYVNANLPRGVRPINKLSDLSNGIALIRMFENVSGNYRPASLKLPNPSLGDNPFIPESQRLELVLGCFDFLADHRIDMNGISPNDVYSGNDNKIGLLLSRVKSRYPSNDSSRT